jgi:hypothetical protein
MPLLQLLPLAFGFNQHNLGISKVLPARGKGRLKAIWLPDKTKL